ncbi:MAG: alpha/beta hydrolase, partial [Candidatus Puniceispirillum sp.]
MKHQLDEMPVHIATGGRPFDPTKTVVLFLHGSGQNHLTWVLQSRYFAYRDYAVLTPDFPGHGLSGGDPLPSIEAMADWVIALMDSLDVKTAVLVGHSQGCLVALDAAARYTDRVSHLGLIAGALAIPVNAQLLSLADHALAKAFGVMVSGGHGPLAHMHDNTQPGHSFIGYGNRLMDMNRADALRTDLGACNDYKAGPENAAKISQPALCILAGADRMTPVKFGQQMAASLANSRCEILPGAG